MDTESLSRTDIKVLLNTARWALALTWRIHKYLLLGVICMTLLHSMVPATLAVAVRNLVNAVSDVLRGNETGSDQILIWLGVGFGITLIETLGGFALKYYHHRLHDEMNLTLTSDILEHAAVLDVAYFEDPRFQDILERTQQGVAQRFSMFVSKTLIIIANIIQMISLTGILAVIEPLVILVLLVIAFPYLFFQWRLAKERYEMEFNRITKQRWTRYFVTRLISQEWVPETKLLRLAPLLISKFRALMTEFRDHNRFIHRRILKGSSLFASISSLAFYLTFVRVALRVVRENLTIGDVAIYGGAMGRLRSALERAILTSTEALEHTLYIANLRQFFAIQPTLHHSNGAGRVLAESRGEITLRDVGFTYPGASKPTLNGVSLYITPGETIAIVGRNGAGKTTLVKLIARLYNADEGEILFDGVDIRELSLDYLHQQLSFVFQRYGRYEATASQNIAYGNWQKLMNDQAQIEQVAKLADAHGMINQMPDGYDTLLGRMFGTYTLSGGQWQKIAIARAFARDAALLILDEPTSNLDPRAEYKIFSNFRELAKGRTTILISHRFSTVSMADRIMVMDKGKIVERGTHQELLAQDGHYAALYRVHRRRFDGWED